MAEEHTARSLGMMLLFWMLNIILFLVSCSMNFFGGLLLSTFNPKTGKFRRPNFDYGIGLAFGFSVLHLIITFMISWPFYNDIPLSYPLRLCASLGSIYALVFGVSVGAILLVLVVGGVYAALESMDLADPPNKDESQGEYAAVETADEEHEMETGTLVGDNESDDGEHPKQQETV